MNDTDVVKIARKIDKLNAQITELVFRIQESDHPNAVSISEWLRENYFDNPALATHCVFRGLEHHDRWTCYPQGIQRNYVLRRKYPRANLAGSI